MRDFLGDASGDRHWFGIVTTDAVSVDYCVTDIAFVTCFINRDEN